MAKSSSHLHQAGNYIHGHFQNHGVQLTGNSFNVNGNFSINTGLKEKDPEKECRRALRMNFSDPIDDRAKILSLKPRLITATCDWIIEKPQYKTWRNIRTRSQLLWVSGGQARGKTMLSIFLTQEFDRLSQQHGEITVLYYFIDRQDKRDTAVHVLRGLIARLVAVRKKLIEHLIEEYEVQSDIFGPNSIETLWRVFEAMVRDPIAGQVYCVLDGLDACTEDSLRRLVGRIRDFFLDEPQTVVDEGPDDGNYSYGPRSTKPRSKGGAGLKMMLVSREEPEWLKDHLKDFPRITIGGGSSKKTGNAGPSSAKPPKKAPKLADIAASIVRKQTMDKLKNEAVVAGPSSASTANNHTTVSVQPGSAVAVASPTNTPQTNLITSGAVSLSSGAVVAQNQPVASPQQNQIGGTLALADVANAAKLPSSVPSSTAPVMAPPSTQPQHIVQAETHTPMNPPAIENNPTSALPALPVTTPVSAPVQTPEPTRIENSVNTSTVPVPYVIPAPTVFLENVTITAEPTQYPPEKPTIAEEHVQEEEHEVHEDVEEDPDYNPSLRLYIEARMEEVAKERQYPTEVQSFICAALEFRGDGTFLWVDFAIEELKKVNVDVMEETVNSLPPGLDEMYCRILRNIPPSLVDLVIGLLRWAVCARRPLDLLELTVALNLSHYTPNDAMAFILNAITACGSMITVGEEDLTVNLVHNSLVELLTGETSPLLMDPYLARFHMQPALIDGDIATFCISYLESGPFNDHPICQYENEQQYNQHIIKYPFVPYAASFWPDHLRDASHPYLNLSSPFWMTKSKSRKNWWTTYWAFTTGKGTFLSPSNFTILHLAAYLNLVPLAYQIENTGQLQARLNKRDSHGMTAIDYTVARGHIPMFIYLAQRNAKQDPIGESILELACRKNQREMVALLLDMGWSVNHRAAPVNTGTSLYSMARWLPGVYHEGLELNRDAWHMLFRDVGVHETPLHVVATYGNTAVMELLLDRGADVNAGTTKGFTPIMSASYTGQIECVEMLIERGAMINAVTTDNWLAMHYAAMRGKLPLVELFIEQGIPVDSMTIKSKTALHLAAWAGYVDVVEYLVQKGAQLELKSYKGETPLHLATRHTKPWMVELLLSLGADRTALNNEGFSALQWAQASNINAAKECLRILQTYGMEGYVPWQAPQQPNAAAPTQTPQATGQAQVDPAARRASTAAPPPTRSFGHTGVPPANTFQGFQAEASITVEMNQPPRNPCDPYVPQQQQQQQQQAQPAAAYPPAHPDLSRTQSEPVVGGPRFAYDPKANMQQFTVQNTGVAYGSMSPPSGPPPPYSAAVGSSPPATYPEKSAAWTAQMDQTSVSQQAPVGQSGPSSPPMYNVQPVQATSSMNNGSQPAGQNAPPVQLHNATTTPMTLQNTSTALSQSSPPPVIVSPTMTNVPTSTPQQPNQGGLVGMLSSMSLNTGTPAPAPTPQACELPASTPIIQTSLPQNTQPYQPPVTPKLQYQRPQTPNMQNTSPAPLMSPFQPQATPAIATPYQAPAIPAQQYQPQQPYQLPMTPIQTPPVQQFVQQPLQQPIQTPPTQFVQQPPPQPLHYTQGLTLNTNTSPTPYVTPPQMQQQPMPQQVPQPTNPYLTPQMTPAAYGQPVQPMPVQSPQFSGNSTASTYHASYTYSAPPVTTPYNPNLGQMGQMGQMGPQMQQPGQWGASPNGGMVFQPPPPSPMKKKSYLGGFITK